MKYSIIAIGKKACEIAECFENYKRYKIYHISPIMNKSNKRRLKLPTFRKIEEYEDLNYDYSSFLKGITNDIYVILSGGHRINGITLKLLETIKEKNISIVYFKENINENQSPWAYKRQQVIYSALQEYTKSNNFKNMFLYDYETLQQMMSNVPLLEIEDRINKTIAYSVDTYNFFMNNEPMYKGFNISTSENKRTFLSCINMINFEEEQEMMFFPLDNIFEKCYHIGVNKEKLSTDVDLLNKIKKFTNGNMFLVYETTENDVGICVVKSLWIQK